MYFICLVALKIYQPGLKTKIYPPYSSIYLMMENFSHNLAKLSETCKEGQFHIFQKKFRFLQNYFQLQYARSSQLHLIAKSWLIREKSSGIWGRRNNTIWFQRNFIYIKLEADFFLQVWYLIKCVLYCSYNLKCKNSICGAGVVRMSLNHSSHLFEGLWGSWETLRDE